MGPASDNAKATYELAFAEAGRGLDAQERAVSELRSRAGVLIAAAAIGTSFFGSRAVRVGDLDVWARIALASFALLAATVLAVLWPRADWQFSADASLLIEEYIEPDDLPLHLVHRDLALHRSSAYAKNAKQLREVFLAFRVGLVALVVETAAWIITLTERV